MRTSYGTLMDLVPWDYIDNIVIHEGYYESEVVEALFPYLKAGGVFWDVGANIGLHAITAAHLNPELQVIAFEPNPIIFSRLQQNASLNRGNIKSISIALGAKNASVSLHLVGDGNSGMSSTIHAYDGPVVSVEQRTAHSLMDEKIVPAPTALKLDVEGAELAVLQGFEDLSNLRDLRIIVFEADKKLLENPAAHPVARLLQQAGFELSKLSRNEDTDHSLANFAAVRI